MKESIFDILGSMGGVSGLTVVDLFCGSGALGIEALSRGASHVTFVDGDAQVLAAAAANLDSVGLDRGCATFRRERLPGWTPPSVDLVLADPPYDFDGVAEVLATLSSKIIVLESREVPDIPGGWRLHRQRRYGSTLVSVLIIDDSPAAV